MLSQSLTGLLFTFKFFINFNRWFCFPCFATTTITTTTHRWIYLEPIFSVGTLKNEETIFMRIDKDFRYIMREIEHDGKILSLLKINNIMAIINALINQLTRCQNTLTTYITVKRNTFARFYFLGDDDLLEILGQSSKEAIIQKHIKKIFPGVHRLGIMNRGKRAYSQVSVIPLYLRILSPAPSSMYIHLQCNPIILHSTSFCNKSTVKLTIK